MRSDDWRSDDWSFWPCTICGRALGMGARIGDGDGTGQRFAHAECYRAREAATRNPSPNSGSAPVADLDLDAIEARAASATPGPWERKYACVWRYVAGPDVPFSIAESGEDARVPEDATFIAAARTDVPALVAEVRRLRAQVGALERGQDVATRSLGMAMNDLGQAATELEAIRSQLAEVMKERDEAQLGARLWYNADGTTTLMASAEAVIAARKLAAQENAQLRARLSTLEHIADLANDACGGLDIGADPRVATSYLRLALRKLHAEEDADA